MAEIRRRFVDAHMHLWDAAVNRWYDFPQPGDSDFGLGLKEPFPDRFVWDDYLEAVSPVDLVKWVHVSALTSPEDAERESAWVASIAREQKLPYALIGALDLTLPLSEIEAALDREMLNPAYRGIRLLQGVEYGTELADGVFSMLSSRRLVYDVVANPGGIAAAAKGLERNPDLTVVLEHAGWPLGLSQKHFEEWQTEMSLFASLPNAYCKLSGIAMVTHRIDTTIFGKFFDECIRLFGANRCMFASNFPVDLCYGDAADFFAVFEEIASALPEDEATDLFSGTAERAYRV